ncbi:MAG: ATP-binding cassette domain-containing protein, partial [Burkholderiales bacterium]|nr:ATP-binding cassette domain-containing protein [Burkholderiales bacterium]
MTNEHNPFPITPDGSPAAPILALTGICKRFQGIIALHEVALNVRAGEVMALIGENGAGKSTLVKTLTGIYQPDSGSIHIAGKQVLFANP